MSAMTVKQKALLAVILLAGMGSVFFDSYFYLLSVILDAAFVAIMVGAALLLAVSAEEAETKKE